MIRSIAPCDAPAVHGILVESLGYGCDQDVVAHQIEELSGDPRFISLVYADDETGQVQGFVHVLRYDTLHSRGGWDVITLGVTPSQQGRGIGKQLLQAVEQEALQRGGTFVRLNSRVERTAAHGFYEHLGYTCDKTQKRFVKQLADLAGGDMA